MKKTQHWSVVMNADNWPTIQMKGQDSPLIIFANDTVLGQRSAVGWANTIAAWMNEQMRLGDTANKPRNCDAMLLAKLRETEAELHKLNLENQDIHSRFMKAKQANIRAADALRGFVA